MMMAPAASSQKGMYVSKQILTRGQISADFLWIKKSKQTPIFLVIIEFFLPLSKLCPNGEIITTFTNGKIKLTIATKFDHFEKNYNGKNLDHCKEISTMSKNFAKRSLPGKWKKGSVFKSCHDFLWTKKSTQTPIFPHYVYKFFSPLSKLCLPW